MDNELYINRKKEYRTPSFRNRMVLEVGNKCYNCGRDNKETYIEYHHVVPLALGGTNSMTNIVALCRECHHLAHGSKDVRKLNRDEPSKMGGRPRFQPVDNYKEILDRFIRGEIGKTECQRLIGIKSKCTKLNDMDFYHEYLEELNIVYMRNLVDFHKSKCADTDIVSYVVHNDGTRIDYTESGKEIKSMDMTTVIKCQSKKRKKKTRIYTIAQ